MKYHLTYQDPRGKWYLRSKSYYSFGSTLHKVLERFHDSSDSGVTTTHQAVAALEESWIEAGYNSQEEMMQAMAEGKAIVEGYIEQVKREPVTASTLLVEKMLRMDMGEFVMIGRLDRVDEHPDGTLEVVDYKSGRSGVSSEDVESDLAMGIYQLLLREHYPGRPTRATIIALRAGTRASSSLSTGDAESMAADLRVLGGEILNRDWEDAVPVRKSLCAECDFLPICRKHPEFGD